MTHYSAMIAKLSPIDSAVALEVRGAGKCCRERGRERGRGGGGGCWWVRGGLLKCSLDSFSGLSRGFCWREVESSLSCFFFFRRVASARLQQHVHSGTPAESHMPPYAPFHSVHLPRVGCFPLKNRTKPKKKGHRHPNKRRFHVLIIAVNTSPSSVSHLLALLVGLNPERGLLSAPSSSPLSWLILPALYLIAIR